MLHHLVHDCLYKMFVALLLVLVICFSSVSVIGFLTYMVNYNAKSFSWVTDNLFLTSLTAGYIDLPDVFKMGFTMALVNAIIWGVTGTFWWKFLGLY